MKRTDGPRCRSPLATTVGIALCLVVAGEVPWQVARDGTLAVRRGPREAWSASLADEAPAALGVPGNLHRLQEIARDLGINRAALVLVDPEITLTTSPEVPPAHSPITETLRALCASLHGVAWRRIDLTPERRTPPPPAEVLAAAVRALERLEPERLVVAHPSTKRATFFRKEPAELPSRKEKAVEPGWSKDPVYLLYNPSAGSDGKRPESRLADLEQQQVRTPAREEHLALAMLQMMQLLRDLPPETRDAFIQRVAESGTRLWDATPPQQREEVVRQSMELMRRFGTPARERGNEGTREGSLPRFGAGGDSGGGGNAHSFAPSLLHSLPPEIAPGALKRLTNALADRYHARVVVDPAIGAVALPAQTDAAATVERALDSLAGSLPTAAWCRVYLPEEGVPTRSVGHRRLEPARLAEALANSVRVFGQLETGSLRIEDATSGRTTTCRKEQPVGSSFEADLEAAGCSARPIYLLYSTVPASPGETLPERFAALRRRQIALLVEMNPEQMAASMERWLQAFQTGDPATRARIMGLPIMAGMMAVWMPRMAQEGRGGENP